jgi:hypothetical protein
MERFFTPTQRFRVEPLDYSEVQLAVSMEVFMNHRWDWSDFRAFATGDEGEMWKVLWITNDTCIWVEDDNTAVGNDTLGLNCAIQRATFTATSGETHVLVLAVIPGCSLLSAGASGVFWHAVTTGNCKKLRLKHICRYFELCSGPALLQFLEASPGLDLLEFEAFAFKESHCRALETLERTGLEVTFHYCSFDPQGAEGTFIEWLRHSQVVTKLESCIMEDSIISALSGNSSVKSLSTSIAVDRRGNNNIRSLAGALPGNQGLEYLLVETLSAEPLILLLRSLWAHPRIQTVKIIRIHKLSAVPNTSMMNAVLRLAQCNTVVHTIDLPDDAKDEEFFQNSILPRLEMNRSCFEDQRQALTRAGPSIRGQLLGRALHVVRNNPDLLFRFLSENVPAFVRSDEDGPIIPTV